MTETTQGVTKGEGYAVANLRDLGEGPGFRKIRKELGVTAFGVNAIVVPPSYDDRPSLPREAGGALLPAQRTSRDRIRRRLHPRARSRRTAPGSTPPRCAQIRNLSDSEDAVYVVVGGKDGYVGRDGKLPEDESIERLAQDHALSKGREFGENAPPGA